MCSHLFGKNSGLTHTIDEVAGGILGAVGGFFLGGPAGAAIGGGLGASGGSALGGGTLTQDVIGGAAGAASGYGLGEGALALGLGADVLGGGLDAAAAGGVGAADLAGTAGEILPTAASDAATAATYGDTAAALGAGVADPTAAAAGAAPLAAAAAPAVPTNLAAGLGATSPTDLITLSDTAATGTDASAGAGAAAGAAPVTQAAGSGGPFVDTATTLDPSLQATAAPGAIAPGATGGNAGFVNTVDTLEPPAPTFGQQVSSFFSPVTNAINQAGSVVSGPTGRLLSTGVTGLALTRDLMNQGSIPGENQLSSLATQLGAEGAGLIGPAATNASAAAGAATAQAATLENYLTTGTLPPALQASLNQATASAVEAAKSRAAQNGVSADPSQNAALASEIAGIQQNSIIQGGSLAATLYSQGLNEQQVASQIYTNLVGAGTSTAGLGVGAQENVVQTNIAQNNQLNNAIANLSTALGGGNRIVTNSGTVTTPQLAP